MYFSCNKKEETYSEIEKEVLALINTYRANNGFSELEMSPIIWKEARNHSKNMALGNIPFGHSGANDRFNRISTEIEAVKNNSFAENVAIGPDAQTIVDLWLTSTQGHKENIEGNYNLTGVGIAVDGTNSYYCTQIFARLP